VRAGATHRLRWTALAILTAFALTGSACGGERRDTRSPILLGALDGMEWDVLLPLLRENRLPTLAGLMERGQFGLLSTIEPTYSPIIWTTVATGKDRTEHGIQGFVLRARGRVYNGLDRRTKAFWNILSDAGRSVAVVGWWMTYPAEPVNGTMVAQVNTLDQADVRRGRAIWKGRLMKGLEGQVHPPSREPEVLAIHDEVERTLPARTRRIFGSFPHPFDPLTERLWKNTQWAFRADETYLEIAQHLTASQEPYDLLTFYLGGPDVVGHRFWRYMAPEAYEHPPPAAAIENFGDVIEDYYVYVDSSLGRILEGMPGNPTVILISDHGMHASNRGKRFDPDDLPMDVSSGGHGDAPPGILIAAGPRIVPRPPSKPLASLERSDLAEVGSVFDITPTLLALLDLPPGADMPGRVLTELIDVPSEQIRRIPSHDSVAWRAQRASLTGDDVQPRAEEARLEQLRALGYIR
jgi:hypothetical protein